ncbi:hypothetical protein DFH09DRAFT_1173019 [Mycena vulgaris]|nr:hypothetical protein DFH09DRAFT_1173019 [Mycena vulgaris]
MFSKITSHFKPRTQHYKPPPGPPPPSSLPPPVWAPASGQSHEESERNASLTEYETANSFCERNPTILLARIFPPDHKHFSVDRWGLVSLSTMGLPIPDPGFTSIHVEMENWTPKPLRPILDPDSSRRIGHCANRGDTCFISNLPIIAGQYSVTRKRGAYFEITIHAMPRDSDKGTIALGIQCLPYPPNRLPGWHRRSAALHLDDRRIYFEDSEGGTDYMRAVTDERSGRTFQVPSVPEIRNGDTLGCGYEFNRGVGVGHLFYTHNGTLLPIAFHKIFDPEKDQEVDVFAAVGVTNGPVRFEVNFGGKEFKWRGPSHSQVHKADWTAKEWNVEGLFDELGDEPPQYGA